MGRKPKDKVINSDGYVAILIPGQRRYKLEHRLVMEQHLGRELTRKEHVHHINENRQDNRIENLIVLDPGEHHRLHKAGKTKGRFALCHPERKHEAQNLCLECYSRLSAKNYASKNKQKVQMNMRKYIEKHGRENLNKKFVEWKKQNPERAKQWYQNSKANMTSEKKQKMDSYHAEYREKNKEMLRLKAKARRDRIKAEKLAATTSQNPPNDSCDPGIP